MAQEIIDLVEVDSQVESEEKKGEKKDEKKEDVSFLEKTRKPLRGGPPIPARGEGREGGKLGEGNQFL